MVGFGANAFLTFYNAERRHAPSSRPMVRPQCTASLRKYGFCGILAVIYAAKLPMPSSIAKLMELLNEMKKVLCHPKGKWSKSKPKYTGAISITDTIFLLHHYKTCEYRIVRSRDDEGAPAFRKWIKSVSANTCYIVHLKSHALFVEVGSIKSKWRIYDQSGVHTKQDTAWLDRIGGYGRQSVVAVIEIKYTEAPSSPSAASESSMVAPVSALAAHTV